MFHLSLRLLSQRASIILNGITGGRKLQAKRKITCLIQRQLKEWREMLRRVHLGEVAEKRRNHQSSEWQSIQRGIFEDDSHLWIHCTLAKQEGQGTKCRPVNSNCNPTPNSSVSKMADVKTHVVIRALSLCCTDLHSRLVRYCWYLD